MARDKTTCEYCRKPLGAGPLVTTDGFIGFSKDVAIFGQCQQHQACHDKHQRMQAAMHKRLRSIGLA